LPLGANTLIAERVALDLSSRLQLVVAPTFHYGLTKPDWAPYPGTGTLRRKTLHRAINELLASWTTTASTKS
jgi:creatinine amidohydrolase